MQEKSNGWGGVLDWGDGSIKVNSGQSDNTILYLVIGLLSVLLILKNKK